MKINTYIFLRNRHNFDNNFNNKNPNSLHNNGCKKFSSFEKSINIFNFINFFK